MPRSKLAFASFVISMVCLGYFTILFGLLELPSSFDSVTVHFFGLWFLFPLALFSLVASGVLGLISLVFISKDKKLSGNSYALIAIISSIIQYFVVGNFFYKTWGY